MTDFWASSDDETAVCLLLPYDETAPSSARQAVEATLTRWQLLGVVDECVLVASELVTNALQHGAPPLVLTLRHRDDRLRLDVLDCGPPAIGPELDAHPEDRSGRGLLVVRRLVDDFGVDPETLPGVGKTIHAEWNTRPAA